MYIAGDRGRHSQTHGGQGSTALVLLMFELRLDRSIQRYWPILHERVDIDLFSFMYKSPFLLLRSVACVILHIVHHSSTELEAFDSITRNEARPKIILWRLERNLQGQKSVPSCPRLK